MLRATDVLANERTYLAYVRTALAFVAFGFVIARFSLFTKNFPDIMHLGGVTSGVSTAFGPSMAVFGVLVAGLGSWRYADTDRGLRGGRVLGMRSIVAHLLSLVVAAIGAVVAFELLAYK